MQYRYLSCSVIFAEINNATLAVYTRSPTRRLHATEALLVGKKSMHVHEGPLHLPTTARLPCFISLRGKMSRWILLEQRGIHTHVYETCLYGL
jgi:hypothetical protein